MPRLQAGHSNLIPSRLDLIIGPLPMRNVRTVPDGAGGNPRKGRGAEDPGTWVGNLISVWFSAGPPAPYACRTRRVSDWEYVSNYPNPSAATPWTLPNRGGDLGRARPGHRGRFGGQIGQFGQFQNRHNFQPLPSFYWLL